MVREPDFYLTSTGEMIFLFTVRSCYIEKRIAATNRDDYLLVTVSPAISAMEGPDIEKAVLAVRHAGSTLFPVNRWPMPVHVCKIMNADIIDSGKSDGGDISSELWGELYSTFDEAKAATDKYAEELIRLYGSYETM